MLPFGLKGRQTVKSVAPAGSYTVADGGTFSPTSSASSTPR